MQEKIWSRGWMCDGCGLRIDRPEHAVVEWLDPKPRPMAPRGGYAVQIVHRRPYGPNCRYGATEDLGRGRDGVGSRPLTDFVGVDGLTLLLRMLVTGRLEAAEAEELFRRVRLPGYDRFKAHLQDALDSGVLPDDCEPRFPKLEEIGTVLDWIDEESGCNSETG